MLESRTTDDERLDGSALVDPVPEAALSKHYGQHTNSPHEIEVEIQRLLLEIDELDFTSLEVHRMRDGVCLSGSVRAVTQADVTRAESVATLPGIVRVVNQLMVQFAPKGNLKACKKECDQSPVEVWQAPDCVDSSQNQ